MPFSSTFPCRTPLESKDTPGWPRLPRRFPIIVLTGSEDATIEKQLIMLGARDYLRKGHFNGKLLASVLVNWVSLARANA